MSAPGSVSYRPRPDATPEAESSALAAVYRLVIDAAQKKEAAEPRHASDPDNGTESKEGSADDLKYTA